MFPRSKKSLSAILLLTSLLATEAGATQVVENADRGHVQVNISVNETNRLAIDGRRIANVVPSVKGVLAGQKDEALVCVSTRFDGCASTVIDGRLRHRPSPMLRAVGQR
jgi:hypothetical protein